MNAIIGGSGRISGEGRGKGIDAQPTDTVDVATFVHDPATVAPLTGQRLGVYHLQTLLGRGGMGDVYRARDTRLGRDVAIKVLPSATVVGPDRLARFEREARIVAALNHPHIAAIYGVEERDGVRGLVLELVEGDTLAERLSNVEGLLNHPSVQRNLYRIPLR